MNFLSRISEKAFFKGGAAIIVAYLLMALCAMYFSFQNIKQVREQNIRNEGNVKKEFLRHEMHNLFEVPRQLEFLVSNSLYLENQLSPTALQPLKDILKQNKTFLKVSVLLSNNTVYLLKGNAENIPMRSFEDASEMEIVQNRILRYHQCRNGKYCLIYDISLKEFNAHLAENQLGIDYLTVVTLPNGQILFSPDKKDWGEVFRPAEHYDWRGEVQAEKAGMLKIYFNFPTEHLEKGISKVSKILLLVSATAFLVLVILYVFYFKAIKKERSISTELSEQNQKLQLENERRLKENALLQLQQIKTQVNPHFLFNSLNSLKSLIEINAPQSNEFVQKLADVYRYVLKNNDTGLVEASEEIRFVKEYFYLQKIRFGSALEIEIDGEEVKGKVPFLALQTLIENAIKHNVFSKKEPLKIKIKAGKDFIVIQNKINLREASTSESMGIGLEYLRNIYRFYDRQDFDFSSVNGIFIVYVPLIG